MTIYGSSDTDIKNDRVGITAFNLEGMNHALVAAVLGYEWGIGVRNGCFCAHPYVIRLLNLSSADVKEIRNKIASNDWADLPGLVRISFGIYNTEEEIDYFIQGLSRIIKYGPAATYQVDKSTGEYFPQGVRLNFKDYFSI